MPLMARTSPDAVISTLKYINSELYERIYNFWEKINETEFEMYHGYMDMTKKDIFQLLDLSKNYLSMEIENIEELSEISKQVGNNLKNNLYLHYKEFL